MHAPRTAAIFDLDKTLLSATSARLFVSYLRHRGILWRYLRKQAIFSAAAALIGLRLGITDTTSAIQSAARLSAGSNVDELWEVVGQWFEEMVRPMIRGAALSTLAWHRAQGHLPVICSASSQFSVVPVAEFLDIDHTIYTEWLTDGNVLSGELRLPVAYGAGKVYWVREWASSHKVDLARSYFYSDHISDQPLLEAIGNPVAVSPEVKLQELANSRGWRVVQW